MHLSGVWHSLGPADAPPSALGHSPHFRRTGPAPGLSPLTCASPLMRLGTPTAHRAAGSGSCLRAWLRGRGGPCSGSLCSRGRGGGCPSQTTPGPVDGRRDSSSRRAARRPPFLEGKLEGSDCNFKDSARLPPRPRPLASAWHPHCRRPFPPSPLLSCPPRLGDCGRTGCDLWGPGLGCLLSFCGGFTEVGSWPSETIGGDVSRRLS